MNRSFTFSLGLMKILHFAEKASQQTSEQVNDCCMILNVFRPITTVLLWTLWKLRHSIMPSAIHTWQSYKNNLQGTHPVS